VPQPTSSRSPPHSGSRFNAMVIAGFAVQSYDARGLTVMSRRRRFAAQRAENRCWNAAMKAAETA
jgi:hypothetical protein